MTVTGAAVPTRNADGLWSIHAALAGFAFFAIVGVLLRPLLPVDETRYLSVAWEMWRSGDLIVPRLNGELYTHKPPLLFWLINAAWAVVGVSETAARLVAPAFGCLAVFLTARLERAFFPDASPRAALVLATTGLFLVFAPVTMFDAMLTVAVLLGMSALWRASRDQTPSHWMLFGFALALGVLSKGPVILVHLLPAALLGPLWAADGIRPRRWYCSLALAILFALALVAIWLVPALIAGGEAYQEAVLWKQSAGRMVQSFGHRQPFWFFLAVLPALLWPWGLSLSFWRAFISAKPLSDTASRLCLVWVGSAFLIFSAISGKQSHYLIPELPAFALLFSRYAPDTLGNRDGPIAYLPLVIAFAALCLIAVVDLPIRKLQVIDLELSTVGLCAAFLVIAGAMVLLRGRRTLALSALAPAGVVSLYLVASSEITRIYGPYHIASALKSHETYGIAQIGGRYHGEFSFTGRLLRSVDVLEKQAAIAEWIDEHPGGILFGRTRHMPAGTEDGDIFLFRGRSYRLWPVPAP